MGGFSRPTHFLIFDFCDLRWCYLQQTVHFFQSDPHAVSLNKLAFTSLHCSISNYTLKELWSHKPSHKHDSNKYQSKAFVICDHKSDETRSVTHVNKVYLVWLMFRVLSNLHYQHRTNQKLRSWANAVFQNRGVCGQAFPSFRSPSPVIPFFCSRLTLFTLHRFPFSKINLRDNFFNEIVRVASGTNACELTE